MIKSFNWEERGWRECGEALGSPTGPGRPFGRPPGGSGDPGRALGGPWEVLGLGGPLGGSGRHLGGSPVKEAWEIIKLIEILTLSHWRKLLLLHLF